MPAIGDCQNERIFRGMRLRFLSSSLLSFIQNVSTLLMLAQNLKKKRDLLLIKSDISICIDDDDDDHDGDHSPTVASYIAQLRQLPIV